MIFSRAFGLFFSPTVSLLASSIGRSLPAGIQDQAGRLTPRQDHGSLASYCRRVDTGRLRAPSSLFVFGGITVPYIDYRQLRESVDLGAVLALLGFRPVSVERGNRRGRCPLLSPPHEGSRAFSAHRRAWYCHVCRVGGNALDLWQRAKGLSIYEAALDLCACLAITPPYRPTAR
jgi:hypothetical protein